MMRLLSWNRILMKLIRKEKAWGKRKELVFRRGSWLIHHLQNISHLKVYIFWHCVFNDEVPSTSSQIVEQIVEQTGVVPPEISNMNDSAQDKKPKAQTQFFPKQTLLKGKWFWYCLLYLLSHQLMDRVID